nr:hypothetical protein Iba_chr10eCG8680 [Ipomoea batatas]
MFKKIMALTLPSMPATECCLRASPVPHKALLQMWHKYSEYTSDVDGVSEDQAYQ